MKEDVTVTGGDGSGLAGSRALPKNYYVKFYRPLGP